MYKVMLCDVYRVSFFTSSHIALFKRIEKHIAAPIYKALEDAASRVSFSGDI